MRVDSKEALQLARLDRIKFNEIVADGFFPCAPATEKGSSRTFSRDELVALVMFSHLIDLGLPPRRAGQYACSAIRGATDPRMGHVRTFSVTLDGEKRHAFTPNGHVPKGHDRPQASIVLDVDEVRAFVDQACGFDQATA